MITQNKNVCINRPESLFTEVPKRTVEGQKEKEEKRKENNQRKRVCVLLFGFYFSFVKCFFVLDKSVMNYSANTLLEDDKKQETSIVLLLFAAKTC